MHLKQKMPLNGIDDELGDLWRHSVPNLSAVHIDIDASIKGGVKDSHWWFNYFSYIKNFFIV